MSFGFVIRVIPDTLENGPLDQLTGWTLYETDAATPGGLLWFALRSGVVKKRLIKVDHTTNLRQLKSGDMRPYVHPLISAFDPKRVATKMRTSNRSLATGPCCPATLKRGLPKRVVGGSRATVRDGLPASNTTRKWVAAVQFVDPREAL